MNGAVFTELTALSASPAMDAATFHVRGAGVFRACGQAIRGHSRTGRRGQKHSNEACNQPEGAGRATDELARRRICHGNLSTVSALARRELGESGGLSAASPAETCKRVVAATGSLSGTTPACLPPSAPKDAATRFCDRCALGARRLETTPSVLPVHLAELRSCVSNGGMAFVPAPDPAGAVVGDLGGAAARSIPCRVRDGRTLVIFVGFVLTETSRNHQDRCLAIVSTVCSMVRSMSQGCDWGQDCCVLAGSMSFGYLRGFGGRFRQKSLPEARYPAIAEEDALLCSLAPRPSSSLAADRSGAAVTIVAAPRHLDVESERPGQWPT